MTNTKYMTLTFNTNWVDEFDVAGFKIMLREDVIELHKIIYDNICWPLCFHFGTNQYLTFYSKFDILDNIGMHDITDEAVEPLREFCTDDIFGTFPDIKELIEEAQAEILSEYDITYMITFKTKQENMVHRVKFTGPNHYGVYSTARSEFMEDFDASRLFPFPVAKLVPAESEVTDYKVIGINRIEEQYDTSS